MSHNLMQADAAVVRSYPFVGSPVATTTHGSQSDALTSAEPWAAKIKQAWNKSVHSIVEAGQYLATASDTLGQGEWKTLLGLLPFGKRTAERLQAVGESKLIAAHLDQMPPSWRTLYELSRLPEDVFLSALEYGLINPGMQRSDVALLKKHQKPQGSNESSDDEQDDAEEPSEEPSEEADDAAFEAAYDAASIAKSFIAQLGQLPPTVASEVEAVLLRWLQDRVGRGS